MYAYRRVLLDIGMIGLSTENRVRRLHAIEKHTLIDRKGASGMLYGLLLYLLFCLAWSRASRVHCKFIRHITRDQTVARRSIVAVEMREILLAIAVWKDK
jgi:hypothetical protein